MGRDKALLPWKRSTLIQSVAGEVFHAAGNVNLIGSPERYGNLGFPVISDQIEGCGPLGGLHAALNATSAEWNLVVACDMPAVTRELLEELLSAAESSGADALVPATPGGCPWWNPRFTLSSSKCMTSSPRFRSVPGLRRTPLCSAT
jgi:molybdopterin-guanine dinucleotide biosynthesis protein A